MKLYIVRHGETNMNIKGYAQGNIDEPLNARGKKQAALLGELLEVVNFDAVYSSDLKRAAQTTKAIMRYQKCKVTYTKKLREANYGIFDGKPYAELAKYFEQLHERYPKKHYYELQPLNGESGVQVQHRIVRFIKDLYRKHPHDTVLLSTHGRVKRMLIGYLQGVPIASLQKIERFYNCSLTIVEFDAKHGHQITLQNHVKHLKVLSGSSYAIQKNS